VGTLNSDLLSKDMDAVLNDAVQLRNEFNQQSIQPELILLAMLRRPNTAAWRLFRVFNEQRGMDMDRLERQVRIAAQSRRDQNGNLDFIARGNKKVPMSRQSIIMLDDALSVANAAHETRIDTDHALQVLAESSMSTSGLLRQESITPKSIMDIVSDNSVITRGKEDATTHDVVKEYTGGKVNTAPMYYREELLREMISILSQAINRHIILIGPDGVGKRSLARSLGMLMAEGNGPIGLSSLVEINETSLLDNEQQAFRAGLSKAHNGILFIPHLHRFFGGPIKAEFSKATPLVQKAFLDTNPVIIATTNDIEYGQRLANVSAITENSQIIRVEETSVEETVEILRVTASSIEREYDIEIEDDALKVTANLARRYLSATPLPRSAEHLIHRTASMVTLSRHDSLDSMRPNMKPDDILDAEDVTIAASQMTGVPVSKLGEDERERYANMQDHLGARIKGQDEAVHVVSRAIKTARVGLKDSKRPIGAFLFLGPTGVGKTELARVLADFMFGSEDAMLPLDMSEFKDESSINRLIGSPTGYVGSEEGGQLTERVRQQPYIIVLFDEVEKAHPRIMDILLQVFEEGRLTDGRGVTTRFSEVVVIMTSNIGSEYLSVPNLTEEIKDDVMEEVRDYLRPEFINRLDEVVLFNALDDDALEAIMRLLLDKESELAGERGLQLSYTDSALTYLLSLNDQPEYGARPLKRILRRYLREPLADFLLKANPPAGTEVKIGRSRKKNKGLKFSATVDGEEIALEH
jgi:ATP-dependent Clp protease ATP-binding subunit ClpC